MLRFGLIFFFQNKQKIVQFLQMERIFQTLGFHKHDLKYSTHYKFKHLYL